MEIIPSKIQCLKCRHYYEGEDEYSECPGFPDGIPEDILSGEFDHREPYPGDRGYRFEKYVPGKLEVE